MVFPYSTTVSEEWGTGVSKSAILFKDKDLSEKIINLLRGMNPGQGLAPKLKK